MSMECFKYNDQDKVLGIKTNVITNELIFLK